MKLNELSKEQLIEMVKQLKQRKKFGLVWEDKIENVAEQCKKELPVLEEVKSKEIISDKTLPTNFLIEGDNYHSLSVLNYTHAGKIDFIYIDPPYNTGNKSWKYNNDYVDEDDTFKHSKWLSMMYKRLVLSKKLLKLNGVICITIDNYELHNLRVILDEIFPNKEITITVIEYNFRGRVKRNFALTHEYAVWILPRDTEVITRKKEISDEIKRNLRRTGQGSRRHESPSLFYGIKVDNSSLQIVDVTAPIRGEVNMPKAEKEFTWVFPIDSEGIERRWYYSPKTVLKQAKEGTVWAKLIKNKIEIHYRKAGKPIRRKSVWSDSKYDSSTYGTELLTKILGENNFPYPKSLYAVKESIESATDSKEAIILDFFAGSGTTGHAVLELNKEDKGKRRFILCTNNENGIAEDICYPRIKKVIEGYSDIKGIPANLKYFRTSFVKKSTVTDDTRELLVQKSVEMICVKEETFNEVVNNADFKVYKDPNHSTGILFNLESITKLKEALGALKMPSNIYVFSLTNDTYSNDFEDLPVEHKLCPIPESILEVYRKLFKE